MTTSTRWSGRSANTRMAGAAFSAAMLVLAASPFVVSAPARADFDCPAGRSYSDCVFLYEVRKDNPSTASTDDSKLIARGRQVCGEMEADATRLGLHQARVNETTKLLNSYMARSPAPPPDAAELTASLLVIDATGAYCPEFDRVP